MSNRAALTGEKSPAAAGKALRKARNKRLPNECRAITRAEVPPIPDGAVRVGSVIDVGPHRWRFEGDALVRYIEYQPPDRNIFPWKLMWSIADSDPAPRAMLPGDL